MPDHDFFRYAHQSPRRLALVDPNGRHWSRGELLLECERLAGGLRQRGLVPGDRVALALPNCAQFIALALATARIGCEITTWEADDGSNGTAAFLRGERPQLVVGHEQLAEAVRSFVPDTGVANDKLFAVGKLDGFQPYTDLLASAAAEYRNHGGAMQENPSGAASRHGSILIPFGIEPEQDNVHYCGLSLSNRGARASALDSLDYGHTVILADRWSPLEMLRDIARYRVTTSYMVPCQFAQLLGLSPEVRKAHPVSSIRHVICPVLPCPRELKQAMTDWWGAFLYECDGPQHLGTMRAAPSPGLPQNNHSIIN